MLYCLSGVLFYEWWAASLRSGGVGVGACLRLALLCWVVLMCFAFLVLWWCGCVDAFGASCVAIWVVVFGLCAWFCGFAFCLIVILRLL